MKIQTNILSQIAISAGLALTLAACGPKTAETSQIKHDFGNTIRPGNQFPDCSQLPYAPGLKASQNYLEGIKKTLTDANPNRFENLCVRVIPSDDFNALSLFEGGLVLFNSKVLEVAQSDSEIAAVLSHEMAHLTMQHGNPKMVHPRLAGNKTYVQYNIAQKELSLKANKLANDLAKLVKEELQPRLGAEGTETVVQLLAMGEDVPSLGAEVDAIVEKAKGLIEEVAGSFIDLMVLSEKKTALGESLGVPANVQISWAEQEADEVGYEYYTRAGYYPTGFAYLFFHAGMVDDEGRDTSKQCLKTIANFGKPGFVPPERGDLDHPSPCWRLYNVVIKETSLHLADYRKFIGTEGSQPKQVKPSLLDAKLEIARLKAEQ